MTTAEDVLTFWFEKNDDFDNTLHEKFGVLHKQAAAGELAHWEAEPRSCLALILVLDQFSPNMFRGDPRSSSQDQMALAIAKRMVAAGVDKQFTDSDWRKFIYLPYEHSEDLADQDTSVQLLSPISEENADYAERHRVIIQRFGRFSHRNEALGRKSTDDENAFLTEPNSSF
jgi:uncharacterized protein (DUF924 family)